jgi:Pyruvate/2-oxoacid:ferredoxin oxidoreductase gamma subunit
MEKEIDTSFLVNLHTDGTFSVNLELDENLVKVSRVANTSDVYQTAQQIVKEIDSQLLVDRIVNTFMAASAAAATATVEQTVPEVVKEKLAERGIKPESNDPVE